MGWRIPASYRRALLSRRCCEGVSHAHAPAPSVLYPEPRLRFIGWPRPMPRRAAPQPPARLPFHLRHTQFFVLFALFPWCLCSACSRSRSPSLFCLLSLFGMSLPAPPMEVALTVGDLLRCVGKRCPPLSPGFSCTWYVASSLTIPQLLLFPRLHSLPLLAALSANHGHMFCFSSEAPEGSCALCLFTSHSRLPRRSPSLQGPLRMKSNLQRHPPPRPPNVGPCY